MLLNLIFVLEFKIHTDKTKTNHFYSLLLQEGQKTKQVK